MTSPSGSVMGGVDAHTDTHDAAALDERGRLLGVRTFASTPEGNRQLLAWLQAFGPIGVIGVESTGSYAAGLVRYLRSRDQRGRGQPPARAYAPPVWQERPPSMPRWPPARRSPGTPSWFRSAPRAQLKRSVSCASRAR